MPLVLTANWRAAMRRDGAEPRMLLKVTDGISTFRAIDGFSDSADFELDPIAVVRVDPIAAELDPISRGRQTGSTDITVNDSWIRPILVANRMNGMSCEVRLGERTLNEVDYAPYFNGIIDQEPIATPGGNTVQIQCLDFWTVMTMVEIKGTWPPQHPLKAIELCLIRGGVPASFFDAASLDPSQPQYAALSHFLVTRRDNTSSFAGPATDATVKLTPVADLIDQLSEILNGQMVVDENGLFTFKLFDPTEASQATWGDNEIDEFEQESNDTNLINRVSIGWDGYPSEKEVTRAIPKNSFHPRIVWTTGETKKIHGFVMDNLDSQDAFKFPGAPSRVLQHDIVTDWLPSTTIKLAFDVASSDVILTVNGPNLDAITGMGNWTSNKTQPAHSALSNSPLRVAYFRIENEVVKVTAFTNPALPNSVFNDDQWFEIAITVSRGQFGTVARPHKAYVDVVDISLPHFMATERIERFANGVPFINLTTSLLEYDKQTSDLVRLNHALFLAFGFDGIVDTDGKWEIVKKEVDVYADPPEIRWSLMFALRESPLLGISGSSGSSPFTEALQKNYFGDWVGFTESESTTIGVQDIVVSGYVPTAVNGLLFKITAGSAGSRELMHELVEDSPAREARAGSDTYVYLEMMSGNFYRTAQARESTAPNILPAMLLLGRLIADGGYTAGGDPDIDALAILSTDGAAWAHQVTPKNFALRGAANEGGFSGGNGTRDLAVMVGDPDGIDAFIIRSLDGGESWLESANPSNTRLNAVASGPIELHVCVGAADGIDPYIIGSSVSGFDSSFTERAAAVAKNFDLNGVIFGAGRFVAVGNADGTDSLILTSKNGATGTWVESACPKNLDLFDVAFGNGVFVAVGELDTDAWMIISDDGIEWSEIPNPALDDLRAVTFNNGRFIAVGDGGIVITSLNGSDWTLQTTPTTDQLNGIAFRTALGVDVWIAVGVTDVTDAMILRSINNGVTWVEIGNPSAANLNDITAHDNGRFVAVGEVVGGDSYIVQSTDGLSWNERTSPKAVALNSVHVLRDATNQKYFVACGDLDGATDSFVLVSTDGGLTWFEQITNKNFNLNSVASGPVQGFMAVGVVDGGGDTYIAISHDGENWFRHQVGDLPDQISLAAVTVNDEGLWVVGGEAGAVWLSQGGQSFTDESSATIGDFADIAFGRDTIGGPFFVACAGASVTDGINTSPDGSNWTARATPKAIALRGIAHGGNGVFVAVGDFEAAADTYIIFSDDGGLTWVEVSNPGTVGLNAVTFTGGRFVAVGDLGSVGADSLVMTSIDGKVWVEQTSPRNVDLNCVSYGGSIIHVDVTQVKKDNSSLLTNESLADLGISTSIGASIWTEQSNPLAIGLLSIVFAENQFVAVGSTTGTNPYLVTSPEGIEWTTQVLAVPVAATAFGVTHGEGTYVAVGLVVAATAPLIITTGDGTSWIRRSITAPKAFDLFDVAHDGGSVFVAVGAADGTDSYIVRSTDGGVTWAEQSNPKNFDLFSVIWSTVHSLFIAVGADDGTDPYIITSPTGASGTWTEQSMSVPTTGLLRGIAEDTTTGLLVAVGADGIDALLAISRNGGVTWQEVQLLKDVPLNNVSFSDGIFVAVGNAWGSPAVDAYMLYSNNGTDWIETQNPKSSNLQSITNNGDKLWVAVGPFDGADAYIVRSVQV